MYKYFQFSQFTACVIYNLSRERKIVFKSVCYTQYLKTDHPFCNYQAQSQSRIKKGTLHDNTQGGRMGGGSLPVRHLRVSKANFSRYLRISFTRVLSCGPSIAEKTEAPMIRYNIQKPMRTISLMLLFAKPILTACYEHQLFIVAALLLTLG